MFRSPTVRAGGLRRRADRLHLSLWAHPGVATSTALALVAVAGLHLAEPVSATPASPVAVSPAQATAGSLSSTVPAGTGARAATAGAGSAASTRIAVPSCTKKVPGQGSKARTFRSRKAASRVQSSLPSALESLGA